MGHLPFFQAPKCFVEEKENTTWLVGLMADVFSPEKRSEIMSKIRGKDTRPEIIVRKFLFSRGFRYRINDKRYPGSPDIVLPKYHTVIFVHGCFWHGHENCSLFKIPKSNTAFWKRKFQKNIDRDQLKIDLLKKDGWKVIVVWECEIKKISTRKPRFKDLVDKIMEN